MMIPFSILLNTLAITVSLESNLVNATPIRETSLNTMKSIAGNFGLNHYTRNLQYDVTSYKIIYRTTYKNQPIEASGLMIVPKHLNKDASIISLQHGTTFSKKDVPSEGGFIMGLDFLASAGYVVVMPDYLGYGTSSQVFHPYYDYHYSAYAVIDLIKAAKDYLSSKNIPASNNIFLAGYSEGGYVTLAAAKEIQLHQKSWDFNLKAVAAGAGSYDLVDMLERVKNNPTFAYPAYLAFILLSYNYTYDWNMAPEKLFQPEVAQKIKESKNSMSFHLNTALPKNIDKMFSEEFYNSLKKNDNNKVSEAIQKNTLSGWRPDFPLKLFHGSGDEVIPYENSVKIYNDFKENGSKEIELIKINNGTHGSSLLPMLKMIIPWFESLKN